VKTVLLAVKWASFAGAMLCLIGRYPEGATALMLTAMFWQWEIDDLTEEVL
jgi:hypothetical protein